MKYLFWTLMGNMKKVFIDFLLIEMKQQYI
jgi:hypothetical protein